jgi:uncharacterized protein YfaQ (DUF2300 family)
MWFKKTELGIKVKLKKQAFLSANQNPNNAYLCCPQSKGVCYCHFGYNSFSALNLTTV